MYEHLYTLSRLLSPTTLRMLSQAELLHVVLRLEWFMEFIQEVDEQSPMISSSSSSSSQQKNMMLDISPFLGGIQKAVRETIHSMWSTMSEYEKNKMRTEWSEKPTSSSSLSSSSSIASVVYSFFCEQSQQREQKEMIENMERMERMEEEPLTSVLPSMDSVGLPHLTHMETTNETSSPFTMINTCMNDLKQAMLAWRKKEEDSRMIDDRSTMEMKVNEIGKEDRCFFQHELVNWSNVSAEKATINEKGECEVDGVKTKRREYYAIAKMIASLAPSLHLQNTSQVEGKEGNDHYNHEHLQQFKTQSQIVHQIISPGNILCRIVGKFLHFLIEEKLLSLVGLLSATLLSTTHVENRGSLWCLFIIAYVSIYRNKGLIDVLLLALKDPEGRRR